MTDWLDEAAAKSEGERDAAIERARRSHFDDEAPFSIDCVACGAEIPIERRQANPRARRCLECQAEFECRRAACRK
jgi:phage/conjugal plasmid C-4 type zinc finger TraR family protein